MIHRSFRVAVGLLFLAGTLIAGGQEDKGETAEAKKLRGRTSAPKATDMDSAATLDSLLSKKDKSAFSEAKAATLEGYVVQVEKEEDGDMHVVLAPTAGETDTKKWVIVEVTPAWQKKGGAFTQDALRKLHGQKVRVTGWLYYEPDEEMGDPRGTRWEIHPVTEISSAK